MRIVLPTLWCPYGVKLLLMAAVHCAWSREPLLICSIQIHLQTGVFCCIQCSSHMPGRVC